MPRVFRNAEAFSQRMPPVQYMMTFLSRSSSARFVRYRAISEYVSAPRSTAPRKCPMEYSFVFRMSRMTVEEADVEADVEAPASAAPAPSRPRYTSCSRAWNSSGPRCVPVAPAASASAYCARGTGTPANSPDELTSSLTSRTSRLGNGCPTLAENLKSTSANFASPRMAAT